MSKHTDVGTVEWDQQLQLLSIIRPGVDSRKFLLMGGIRYYPPGTELDTAQSEYRTELVISMAKAKKIAVENIC